MEEARKDLTVRALASERAELQERLVPATVLAEVEVTQPDLGGAGTAGVVYVIRGL